MTFREGDVLDYEPERTWCREGVAVVLPGWDRSPDVLRVADTFWGSGGSETHYLTESELATAKVLFNLNDYVEVRHEDRHTWAEYSPSHRQRVTSQHGLRASLYVLKGAKPDHATKVANARAKVDAALLEVEAAASRMKWAREDLARLEAEETNA